MDLTTNGVVITDAIKFVQTNIISKQDKDSKESAYDEDEADIEEKQVETKEPKYETTTNQVF
jgi:mannitol-specific phosphotransferase system IIBC component